MNNIIRSQIMIVKHKIVSLAAVFIAAVVAIVTGFLLNPNPAEAFSQPRMDSRTAGGSGLGLYVVKMLCDRLGWTVCAELNHNQFEIIIQFSR